MPFISRLEAKLEARCAVQKFQERALQQRARRGHENGGGEVDNEKVVGEPAVGMGPNRHLMRLAKGSLS